MRTRHDSVGNQKTGTHAAIYTNDAHREIIHPIIRVTTRSAEIESDVSLLRARTIGTPVEIGCLRHDRGPEFTGARQALHKVDIIPVPNVDHGATCEGVNLKVQIGGGLG